MTAFEVFMNHLYDVIEKSEPQKNEKLQSESSPELSYLVRQYVSTSYSHGHQLAYRSILNDLKNRISNYLTGASYTEWERLRLVFIGHDLHVLRRDRSREAAAQLKARLIRHL